MQFWTSASPSSRNLRRRKRLSKGSIRPTTDSLDKYRDLRPSSLQGHINWHKSLRICKSNQFLVYHNSFIVFLSKKSNFFFSAVYCYSHSGLSYYSQEFSIFFLARPNWNCKKIGCFSLEFHSSREFLPQKILFTWFLESLPCSLHTTIALCVGNLVIEF